MKLVLLVLKKRKTRRHLEHEGAQRKNDIEKENCFNNTNKMNLRNLKISTLLIIGFIIMLSLVIVTGILSTKQNNELAQQTETIYNHPLKVRRAISSFRLDVHIMHQSIEDMLLAANIKGITESDNTIQQTEINAYEQIEVFNQAYLGPHQQVVELKEAFIKWNLILDETTRKIRNNDKTEVIDLIKENGEEKKLQLEVLAKLQKIDEFAFKKAEEIYKTSKARRDVMNIQNNLISVIGIIITLIVCLYLLFSIRKPIAELTNVAQRFHDGDMGVRSGYMSKNEYGLLSKSFNNLAESIQNSIELNNKTSLISEIMLKEDDPKQFFQNTLTALLTNTNSSIAAVYFLDEEKKTFDHYYSIGLDDNARISFSAQNMEGEFGAVLSSHKVQHLKINASETNFLFNTVSGKIIPKEIITIPILSGKEVIAVISLANINEYTNQSLKLINNILDTMSARINGVLVYQKNLEMAESISQANIELQSQKTELISQSSELMEQNTELEMQKKQLNEASRLKTNFLSNMSHELRTPLNSVIALSGVLNRRLISIIPEEEYSYLEVIERNGKHLLSLINDILDISRIESGKEEVEITKFNANDLIAEVVSMIEPQSKQRSIELLQPNKENELYVTTDANKCRHILQNLISNAIKFTVKGKVEVNAKIESNSIIITVSDTGIGIAQEHILHIFDEFRQADGSTSRRFGGTGLGLAIAKKYTNLLGGDISVKSTVGEGSEFTITLPLKYAAENRVSHDEKSNDFKYEINKFSKAINTNDASTKYILLVEDSEPVIIQMKDILEDVGYKILTARNGSEALEIISHTIPDAMILDLMMPGIDGFEVLKNLREEEITAHIPVLILTAKHITQEDLKTLKRNNIHQLIQKGDVNRKDLMNAVSKMIYPLLEENEQLKREIRSIHGKPRILVVEDNKDNMTTVKALFGDKYIMYEAFNGNEGIVKAKEHIPDLILMDIALPGIDGIDAFKSIRKEPTLQHIPVIALTASAMVNDREAILAHGFDVYIPKPIDEKVFFKSINEVLYGK